MSVVRQTPFRGETSRREERKGKGVVGCYCHEITIVLAREAPLIRKPDPKQKRCFKSSRNCCVLPGTAVCRTALATDVRLISGMHPGTPPGMLLGARITPGVSRVMLCQGQDHMFAHLLAGTC
jgi:hypothetical protein